MVKSIWEEIIYIYGLLCGESGIFRLGISQGQGALELILTDIKGDFPYLLSLPFLALPSHHPAPHKAYRVQFPKQLLSLID